MELRNDIYNALKADNITDNVELGKTILGFSAMGLLLGRKELYDFLFSEEYITGRRDGFDKYILSCSKELNSNDKDIISDCLDLIPRDIQNTTIVRIINILQEYDDLENIINGINLYDPALQKKYSVIASIPGLNTLVAEIMRMHSGESLLNIDCGTGEFLVKMLDEGIVKRASGSTFESSIYNIARIKKYFSQYDSLNIANEEYFFNMNEDKYDMIYNSYPLGYKYESKEIFRIIDGYGYSLHFARRYSANMLWLLDSLGKTNENGIVVAYVENGVLFNSVDTDIRRELINKGYIEAVISLPTGITTYPGVKASLIVLKKQENHNKSVKLIDATNCFHKQRRGATLEERDIEQILDLYKKNDSDSDVLTISYEDISRNDYNLWIGKYRTVEQTLINPCTLASVTTSIFRGYQINAAELDDISAMNNEKTDYRILNISDLRTDGTIEKELQPVVIEDMRKFERYCLEDGDIIITAKNSTMKVAIYQKHDNCKVILTGNLIAIRANEKRVDPYYLMAFFDSKQGNVILESIQTGTYIKAITPNGLKQLSVSVLSMDQQIEISDEYKNNLSEIVKLRELYEWKMKNSKLIFDNLVDQNERKE